MRSPVLCALGLLLSAVVAAAADPPAAQIAYCRREGDRFLIHVMNADATGDRAIAGQMAEMYLFPAWSPDGKQIACMERARNSPDSSRLTIINVDGSDVRTLPLTFKMAGLPAWSPDGRQLAFSASADGEFPSIHISDTFGNILRQVNPPGTGGICPFWMPDGQTIGYCQADVDGMNAALMLAKADGSGQQEVLKADNLILTGPNGLSRDGKRLVFAASVPGKRIVRLRLWDFANRAESIVLEFEMGDVKGPEGVPIPAWGPDGKSFLIPLPTEKGIGLFRVSEDGKARSRLTPEGVDCTGPAVYLPAR